LALGVSGGLVPCPSALVVLMFAVYVGRIALGLVLISAFSAGLATTLTVLGILVVRAQRLLERAGTRHFALALLKRLPALSAALVAVVGLYMAWVAVRQVW
jgi:nickel/cobalt transporter (NicO) family protein